MYSKKLRLALCSLLSASLIVSATSIPTSASAYSSNNDDNPKHITRVVKANNDGLIRFSYENDNGTELNLDTSDKSSSGLSLKQASVLPSSYSLVDNSLTTSIKDQGYSGSCWAFSAIKAMESNSILKGINSTSVDLSESHLAWFTYNRSKKKKDPLYNDGMYSTPALFNTPITDAYNSGGNAMIAIFTLARWSGAEIESNAPFSADSLAALGRMAKSMKSKENLRYHGSLHLQNAECYDNASRDEIKKALMTKGALNMSMYYDESGLESNSDTAHSYYQTNFISKESAQHNSNHCVTIVGWDDNYSKHNFKYTPKTNGAWLIANSYGTEVNDKGYFWLSYCEPSIGEIYSMDTYTKNNYDNIYQYDGAGWEDSIYYKKKNIKGANVFTNKTKKVQKLKAASFYTIMDGQKYTIQIYKNLTGSTPSTGKLVTPATTNGTAKYNGYHTIPLASDCTINPGEKFAIVVTYKYNKSSGNQALLPIEGESFNSQGTTYSFSAAARQSFYYSASHKKWYDMYKEGNNNICIKAFTVNTNAAPPSSRKSKIKLSRKSISLKKGKSYKISYKLTNASAYANVKFTSSKSSIASVSTNGTIKAKKAGKATIKAVSTDGASASVKVTVKK